MTRIGLLALAATLSLGACAAPSAGQRSYTPKTEVVVKGGNRKPPQANYRTSPEESNRTGSGGSAR
jgi:hypothetical protein